MDSKDKVRTDAFPEVAADRADNIQAAGNSNLVVGQDMVADRP